MGQGLRWQLPSRSLCRSSTPCQFNSSVGFHKSLITGVRQHPAGFVANPLSSQPSMEHSSTALLVGKCGQLKHLRCPTRWSIRERLRSAPHWLEHVVEFHSRNRGKATSGDWAPRPVVVCFEERSKDLYEIVHNLVEAGLGGKRWGWCHCVDSARDGRPPDVRGGIQILGTGIRPMAWPRSARRVRLQPVGGQSFQCAYSLSEISFN